MLDMGLATYRTSADDLLTRALTRLRALTGAEAGTVFLRTVTDAGPVLHPVVLQNDRVPVPPSALTIPADGRSIAGFVSETGRSIRVDDVYDPPTDLPFVFDRSHDERSGYRTRSMYAFPLVDFEDRVFGVVQLINRRPSGTGAPVPFDDAGDDLVTQVTGFIGLALERSLMIEGLEAKNAELQRQQAAIEGLQRESVEAFMVSVRLLSRASGIHDAETHNHVLRVGEYAQFVARELGAPAGYVEEIGYSAQLHDVGKLLVEPGVLRKRGALDAREWEVMRAHTTNGRRILSESPKLALAASIAHAHHERWDGSGYPRGLVGEAIPVAARIVALADVYDALRSARPYKLPLSHARTVEIMLHGDARLDPTRHFAPDLIELFRTCNDGFREIFDRLADP